MRETSTVISFGGYRCKVIALFLCALPLFAEGGIQDVPPWPNTYGTEIMSNGNLEDLTGWTLGACAADSPGNGVGGSDAVAITGECTALQQTARQMTDAYTAPLVQVCYTARKTGGADGTVGVSWRDSAHGTYFAAVVNAVSTDPNQGTQNSDYIVDGGDFLEICTQIAITPNHHAENWRFDFISTDVTTGTWYVDDITVKPAWYPLYNFVKYPNNKGYLWSGYDSHLCAGATADEACGFVDVRPATGTAIADTYVEIHHDTTAGCASPTATVTVQPTVQRTTWEMDLSGVADDATVYICAQLRLDSGGTLIADFPDWKIIKRTTAWRTANLQHWIDDYGRWVDGTIPRFMWMTYQRFAGDNCSNCVWTDALGGTANYLAIKGFDRRRPVWGPFQRSGRNVTNYFSPASGMNPTAGSSTDQFTPWLEALDTLGLRAFQIMNHVAGSLLGRDETESADELAAAPTISCSYTGGSISNAYVYVKVAAIGGNNSLIQFTTLLISGASASAHNTSALSGSTNSCVVSAPARSGREIGYFIYADGAASESEPANASYSLQTTRFIEPGESFTLTSIIDSQREPLETGISGSLGQIPTANLRSNASWIPTTMNDHEVLQLFIDAADANGSAWLGAYIGDEITADAAGYNFDYAKYMNENAPGRLNYTLPLEVRSLPGLDWFYSPIVDINGQDIYHEGQNMVEDLQAGLGSDGRTATCYAYTPGNNVTATYDDVNLNKVDEWTDIKMRSHEGSRMNLPVLMQWTRSSTTCNGFPLAENRKQMWKAIIAMQNWGSIGGLGTWGWVSADGLDRQAGQPLDQSISGGDPRGHTDALHADIKAGAEMMAIEHVLIEPVDDSTQLGFGTILDAAPTSSISLPTTNCTLKDSPIPIRTVAKQMDNGDQWIFATNLCPDSQTMTFSLANATGKIATDYLTGATYTITGGDFDVASTDFDVHVIKVETPKGGGVRGR